MLVKAHQTHHTIGDFESIFKQLKNEIQQTTQDCLHVFPEFYLWGYPLQDLCLQRPYIEAYHQHLDNISQWSCQKHHQRPKNKQFALLGGPAYTFDKNGLPSEINNSIYLLELGSPLKKVYDKILLPNYDIFDEAKYFTAGDSVKVIEILDLKIGLQICEDMWPSHHYKIDPTLELAQQCLRDKINLDLIVNLSASPFFIGKEAQRFARGQEIQQQFSCPFLYVNSVGGEDEILFDGGSFMIENQLQVSPPIFFKAHSSSHQVKQKTTTSLPQLTLQGKKSPHTWESLFKPRIDFKQNKPQLIPLKETELAMILQGLIFGIQEYADKSHMKNFLVALSGGIDSALVLAICKLALKDDQRVSAIYMPSEFSSSNSYAYSESMCQHLQIKLTSYPIKFHHKTFQNSYKDHFQNELIGVADENIQSRLRGLILYTHSNMCGSMVLNTSNKSELAVGYSTQYGDSVGALSVIGDLYKSEVYALSNYINKLHPNTIPNEIISRAPSAELRADQTDSQSLPPYSRLDPLLESILCYQTSISDMNKIARDKEEFEKIYHLYNRSEYKRRQFCPILKIGAKSFGFGYRVPLSKVPPRL